MGEFPRFTEKLFLFSVKKGKVAGFRGILEAQLCSAVGRKIERSATVGFSRAACLLFFHSKMLSIMKQIFKSPPRKMGSRVEHLAFCLLLFFSFFSNAVVF